MNEILSNIFNYIEKFLIAKHKTKVEQSTDVANLIIEKLNLEKQELERKKEFDLVQKKLFDKVRIEETVKSPIEKSTEYIVQGDTLQKIGDFQSALTCYDRSIEQDENAVAYLRKSLVYSLLGDFDSALKAAERALILDPKNWIALNDLGICMLKKGDIQEAIMYLEEAVLISGHSIAYFNLGYILENAKDYFGALRNYNQSMKVNPNNEQAYNSINRLKTWMN